MSICVCVFAIVAAIKMKIKSKVGIARVRVLYKGKQKEDVWRQITAVFCKMSLKTSVYSPLSSISTSIFALKYTIAMLNHIQKRRIHDEQSVCDSKTYANNSFSVGFYRCISYLLALAHIAWLR